MLGWQHSEDYREEGRKAAREGRNAWDNPYSYITEAPAAYCWDEGFKEAEREAA